MFNKLISIYIEDYTKINRYIITSISSYLITIFLIYFLFIYFSNSTSIIIAQIIKIFLIFFMMKYYTFNNNKHFINQFKLYFFFVILSKSLEALAIYIFDNSGVLLGINIFIVLLISSTIKYFIFNKIFSQ